VQGAQGAYGDFLALCGGRGAHGGVGAEADLLAGEESIVCV
jgi:hypothetical protein